MSTKQGEGAAIFGAVDGMIAAHNLVSVLELFGEGFSARRPPHRHGLHTTLARAAELRRLKECICSTLGPQSRLKPYLDAIEFTIDKTGLHFDATALEGLLDQKRAANEQEALTDLLDLNCLAMPLLDAVGFDSFLVLHRWIDA
ncbi:hypothetical protein H6CHR_02718 [Variovorax sp. PBL-H6]|uniref:hypothetical protein n=1 Tax=Variovorax sp. PBL-H6 TaxID=434009 RepID=UPI001316B639|nr:hypothetical protein [Variovorax sp. PBL-H6]VTU27047.1 hypothetical protein H6CHR_02718 [Variovorax sp. PBL-H6]